MHNKRTVHSEKMDAYLPFPYHRFSPKKYDLGFLISSRGCPYECIFCSNRVTTGRNYRFRSAGVLAEELEMLNLRYGRRFIQFLDDNFLVNKERVYLLIDEIRKKGLHKKMTFNIQARGDNVDERILKDLFDASFRSIFFGIESSSESVMKVIKKGETVAQCIEGVKMAKRLGFHVSATFIYGLPTETAENRRNCIKLTRELELDMVRYNNATPYPGTELYEIAKRERRLRIKGVYENFVSVSTFIENPFKRMPFPYVPEGNTEDQIRRDILYSYFSYYLDLRRVKDIFARPELNVGWFNAGENLFQILKKIPALTFLGAMIMIKFFQLFYYMVFKNGTRSPIGHFLKVFDGLLPGKTKAR